jgi:multicomponent Na+:H+ antiporter subunit D
VRAGATLDVPLPLVVDDRHLDDWARSAADELTIPSQDGAIELSADDGAVDITVVEPQAGTQVEPSDVRAYTVDAVEQPGPVHVEIPAVHEPPAVTEQDVEAALADAELAVSAPVVLVNPSPVGEDLELTQRQIGNTVIASVAITIVARLVVGWLTDRFGPRKTYTGLLALGAIGLSLIYGTTGISSFSHAEQVTLGGITCYLLVQSAGITFWLAALLTVLICGATGYLQDRVMWTPLRHRGHGVIQLLIVTIGLSLAMQYAFQTFVGLDTVRILTSAPQTVQLGPVVLSVQSYVAMAFSANLLTFFVFYELLTIATYPLVVHKETPEALEAGRRYLGYLLTGGVAQLLALALIYNATGDVAFQAGGFLGDAMSSAEIALLALLFAIGFGTKSAIIPLHAWLPSAMVAPTPVSALLHAVAVVKAGVFGFARAIGFVIGPAALAEVGAANVLAMLAALTILIASGTALAQDNLKRRLAFSTIAHLSYIVLGLSIASATAWSGAMLHIANHAMLKITLFFCAGAIYATAHLDRVSQLDGIGRQMPVTMGAFAVASIGLAGLPPLGGFWSKWFLALGAVDAGQWPYAVVLLVSGLLTAGYLFPIVFRAFFRPPAADAPRSGEATAFMAAPLAITAGVSLLLGLGDVLGVGALVTGRPWRR